MVNPQVVRFPAAREFSIPVGVVGFLARDVISGTLRDLVVVALALILFSPVLIIAERLATETRSEKDLTMRDAVIIGVVQSISLIPGISRSGATISAGLLTGFDRVSATRLAFFLSIPALTAAGVYGLKDALSAGVGVGPTVLGTVVAFIVAYASIAWLLRFVCASFDRLVRSLSSAPRHRDPDRHRRRMTSGRAALVVAALALIGAWGGPAVARTLITGDQIARNTVTGRNVAGLSGRDVVPNGIDGSDIDEQSLEQVPNARRAGAANRVNGVDYDRFHYADPTGARKTFLDRAGLVVTGFCNDGQLRSRRRRRPRTRWCASR